VITVFHVGNAHRTDHVTILVLRAAALPGTTTDATGCATNGFNFTATYTGTATGPYPAELMHAYQIGKTINIPNVDTEVIIKPKVNSK